MYIVKPELDDQAVQQEIDKVGQLIQTNGGQVKKVTPWGKRRLAYSVKDQREGHYVLLDFGLVEVELLDDVMPFPLILDAVGQPPLSPGGDLFHLAPIRLDQLADLIDLLLDRLVIKLGLDDIHQLVRRQS